MDKIQNIIHKNNPLKLNINKFYKYSSIISSIYHYILIHKSISNDIIQQLFIDNFGESTILFTTKNSLIFNIIYNDIISTNIL
jgi:hypothetical protein